MSFPSPDSPVHTQRSPSGGCESIARMPTPPFVDLDVRSTTPSMEIRMAASKQKKRLMNSTNSEQCRPSKKSKSDSSNCLVSLNPHIGLKWDQCLRRVVPKKEQVGILWSDLAPFIESKKHQSRLADVTNVPSETFSLENLRGVLSYKVWFTCLTEAERKFLTQFLPGKTHEEENVHLLLTGNNYHFGNPFLRWSSSLCYADVYPDAVLNKENRMKKDEKAYNISLLNYCSKMVDTLKKWRKRWLSFGNMENLFRDNPANQNQGVMQLKTTKIGTPLIKVAQSVDVSKFMSYIKVSRVQLKHIKRLKQSGDGIQINHVSSVIGGLNKYNVKPYGALIHDEQRRLREHWLNMSCHDLPAAFEVLKDRKVLMDKSRKLLGLELEEKNVYVSRKADQLTETIKEVGHYGASENDGSLILQNEQSMLQGGDDQRTCLQDWDGEQTKDMNTSINHIHSLNADDHDLMVARGTEITCQTEQNSDVQDHDRDGVTSVGKGVSCCANIADEKNEDLPDIELPKNALGAKDEVIKEISYEDTNHNNYNAESQHIGYIDYTSTHIDTLDCENMQLEDLDGVSYKGPSVHAHEQDRDQETISRAIVNRNCCHSSNISTEMSHPKMNTVIGDQEKTENIMMMPANSSTLLPKPSGKMVSSAEPVSNPQSSGQLQTAMNIGEVSNSIQHAKNLKQLIDESDDGLYAHLHEDYHADVSFPIKANPPISEQHSYPPFASMDHNRHNRLPKGCQPHSSNLSGLDSSNRLTQALPIGSSTDGTLLSAISQYKQPSAHMEHEARNQVSPPINLLHRTQGTNSVPDTYGNTQNMASSGSSHVAPVHSMDNMQWASFIQQNPKMGPDFTNRPSGGPDNSF